MNLKGFERCAYQKCPKTNRAMHPNKIDAVKEARTYEDKEGVPFEVFLCDHCQSWEIRRAVERCERIPYGSTTARSKVVHHSKEAAEKELVRLCRSQTKNHTMRAYPCEDHWHIGKCK